MELFGDMNGEIIILLLIIINKLKNFYLFFFNICWFLLNLYQK